MKMEPPTIYMPESMVETVDRILKLFTKLDRGRMPCNLVGLKPGDEVEVSRAAYCQCLGDQAHGSFAGVCRMGTPQEAEAGVCESAE